MDKKMISGVLITLVVAGSLGFFGGVKYQQSKKITFNQMGTFGLGAGQRQFPGAGAAMRPAGGRAGANSQFINGEVLNKDDKSITVKVGDTGSKIIFYSGSTGVGKTTSGTADDIAVGTQVMISGTTNSDGSITAQNIQIRPQMPALPQGK